MFGISIEHILIVGVILIIVGPRRLPELGNTMGKAIKNFKDSFSGIEEASFKRIMTPDEKPAAASTPAQVIQPAQTATAAQAATAVSTATASPANLASAVTPDAPASATTTHLNPSAEAPNLASVVKPSLNA